MKKEKDIKVISEHKRRYQNHPSQSSVARGKKRVMAIVDGRTQHIDVNI